MTPAQTTAQVAVEAIINVDGDGYDTDTMRNVFRAAAQENISDFYLIPLRSLIMLRAI